MVFRLTFPIEIERPTGDLTASTRVDVQIVHERGKWRAQCQDPPIATLMCDTLEEALKTGAREIVQDWAKTQD